MASKVKAGEVYADFYARTDKFVKATEKTLDQLKKQQNALRRTARSASAANRAFDKLRGGLKGIAATAAAAFSTRAIIQATKESATYGATLVETSDRLGTTVEALQELQYAFESDGVAAERFNQVMTALRRRFAADTPVLQRAVRAVGISMEEWYATGGRLENLIPLISRAIRDQSDETKSLNFLQEALSSSGRNLFTAFRRGPEAFRASSMALRELGIVSGENAGKLKDLDQTFLDLEKNFKAEKTALISANADAFEDLAKAGNDFRLALLGLAVGFTPVIENITELLEAFKKYKDEIKLFGQVASTALLLTPFGRLAKLAKTAGKKAASDWRGAFEGVLTKMGIGAAGLAALGLPGMDDANAEGTGTGASGSDSEAERTRISHQLQKDFFAFRKGELEEESKLIQANTTALVAPVAKGYIDEVKAAIHAKNMEIEKAIELARQETEAQIELGNEADYVKGRFADAFLDAASGAASFGDAVKSLVKDLAMAVARAQLLKVLGVGAGGGEDGGGLFSFIGGLLAEGGPARAGVPYIVGERGPELFVPRTSGTVLPNDMMPAMAGATYNSSVTLNLPPGAPLGEVEMERYGRIVEAQVQDAFTNLKRSSPSRSATQRAVR